MAEEAGEHHASQPMTMYRDSSDLLQARSGRGEGGCPVQGGGKIWRMELESRRRGRGRYCHSDR